jgi:hypothetical protein
MTLEELHQIADDASVEHRPDVELIDRAAIESELHAAGVKDGDEHGAQSIGSLVASGAAIECHGVAFIWHRELTRHVVGGHTLDLGDGYDRTLG